MKSFKELDSVGWRFFAACSVVLYGPSLYVVRMNVYEEKRGTSVPYVFALIIAMITASFLAAGVNSILQKWAESRQTAEKNEDRSSKKKATK